MAPLTFPKPPLQSLSIPALGGLEVCLHRRGPSWSLVFGRAYGMAEGRKLVAALNIPQSQYADSEPSSLISHLNPRFWLRDGLLKCEDVLGEDVQPRFLKDTGLRRTVVEEDQGGTPRKTGKENVLLGDERGEGKGEERLVEVLLKDDQLAQRCAWCGGWEYKYEGDKRHQKVMAKDGKQYYWCGDCSRAPRLFSRHWWKGPESLDDSVYFFCKLP